MCMLTAYVLKGGLVKGGKGEREREIEIERER